MLNSFKSKANMSYEQTGYIVLFYGFDLIVRLGTQIFSK